MTAPARSALDPVVLPSWYDVDDARVAAAARCRDLGGSRNGRHIAPRNGGIPADRRAGRIGGRVGASATGARRRPGRVDRMRLGAALAAGNPDAVFAARRNGAKRGVPAGAMVGIAGTAAASRGLVLGIAGVAHVGARPVLLPPPYLSSDIYRYVWDGRVQSRRDQPVPIHPGRPASRESCATPRSIPQINRAELAPHDLSAGRGGDLPRGHADQRHGDRDEGGDGRLFETVAFVLLLRLLAASGLPTRAGGRLCLASARLYGNLPATGTSTRRSSPLWRSPCGPPATACTGPSHRAALAGATLVKFYPAVLFPALWRRWEWRMPAAFAVAIVLAYLPFLGVGWHVFGFLPAYAEEEGFTANGGGFYLWSLVELVAGALAGLPVRVYLGAAAAILAALAAADGVRPRPVRR